MSCDFCATPLNNRKKLTQAATKTCAAKWCDPPSSAMSQVVLDIEKSTLGLISLLFGQHGDRGSVHQHFKTKKAYGKPWKSCDLLICLISDRQVSSISIPPPRCSNGNDPSALQGQGMWVPALIILLYSVTWTDTRATSPLKV